MPTTRSHRQEELPSRQATRTRQEPTTGRVGTGEAFLRGTASHAKYIGCADRLGERELALCRCAISDRFFLDTDLHIGFPRRCAVSPVVCGRLRILDLLSARPAAADIGHRPENASSGRFGRSAAQFAIGRTALRRRARADSSGGDPIWSPTRVLCDCYGRMYHRQLLAQPCESFPRVLVRTEIRHCKQKHQPEDRHAEGDRGDRQQNLHCSLAAADAAGPGHERAGTPFAKWCDVAVPFVGIGVPSPAQPKNNRNADKDQEEQANNVRLRCCNLGYETGFRCLLPCRFA
jgi:hypothetical protein